MIFCALINYLMHSNDALFYFFLIETETNIIIIVIYSTYHFL